MIFNWPFLLASAVLLWWPAPLWVGQHFNQPDRDSPPRVTDLLRAWQNWVDLARAAAGVCLLRELGIPVSFEAPQQDTTVLIIYGSIVFVGVLLQMFLDRQHIFVLAPVFYLNGITLMMGDYAAGGFAVFVSWLIAAAAGNVQLLLPVLVVALLLGSFLLSEISLISPLNCALVIMPLFVSLLLQKRLSFVSLIQTRTDSLPNDV